MTTRMNRRQFLASTTAAAASAWTRPSGAAAGRRPNIIFLMDDQRRWDALGVIDPAVQTPALDGLARSGVVFDQAVCQAPMCVASRNSMMLGLYPNQVGILRNERGIPDDRLPSTPLPQLFRDAGYQTAGFGKTHWGLVSSTRGFEVRYEAECPEIGAVMMKDDAPEAKARYDAEGATMGPGEENNLGYLGFTSAVPEPEHRDGWISRKCVEFIEGGVDPSRPLFLYLSFFKPHAGHNVPAGYEDRYDPASVEYARQPPWTEDRSPHAFGINRREMYEGYWSQASDEEWRLMTMRYRANCTWIDDMFGRSIRALEARGLLDNALIIYVSDHGEMLGERFYRFNKYCLYESSARVPMILSGSALPAHLRGARDHRAAELVDVYPTLLEATGIPVPARAAGLSLLGGQTREAGFCGLHERKDEAAFMARTPDYKLILRMKRKERAETYTGADVLGCEFYDLRADPQEWNDLGGDPAAFADVKAGLTKHIFARLAGLARVTVDA